MRWRTKADLQNFIARLPFSEALYYALQTLNGSYKRNPLHMVKALAKIAVRLRDLGKSFDGAHVVEIGTGRDMHLPLVCFLLGVWRIDTYDLYPLAKPRLVRNALRWLSSNKDVVWNILRDLVSREVFERRHGVLKCAAVSAERLGISALRDMGIHYHAPRLSSDTGLLSRSVDIHISYTVLEHIPEQALRNLLVEARRILKPGGVAVHQVDPSDHFSHQDSSISAVNFLQFSDSDWARIAGNHFSYHNRMRACEYRRLMESSGLDIVQWIPTVCPIAFSQITQGELPIGEDRFKSMRSSDLATVAFHVTAIKGEA